MNKTPIALRWWFVALEILVFIITFVAFKISAILGLNVFLLFLILLFFTLKAAFPERFEKIKEARIKRLEEKNIPREFKHKTKPAPIVKTPQYDSPNLQGYIYEASFPQAKHFRGFKRIYLSVGIYEPNLEDILALKNLRPNFDLSGSNITLRRLNDRVQVFVDGFHVGTFWNDTSFSASNYRAVAEGRVEKVYVSISEQGSGRYSAYLYVLFKQF